MCVYMCVVREEEKRRLMRRNNELKKECAHLKEEDQRLNKSLLVNHSCFSLYTLLKHIFYWETQRQRNEGLHEGQEELTFVALNASTICDRNIKHQKEQSELNLI